MRIPSLLLVVAVACVTGCATPMTTMSTQEKRITEFYPIGGNRVLVTAASETATYRLPAGMKMALDRGVSLEQARRACRASHGTLACVIEEVDSATQKSLLDCRLADSASTMSCKHIDTSAVWRAIPEASLPTPSPRSASPGQPPVPRRTSAGVMTGQDCPKDGDRACGDATPNIYECMNGVWRVVRTCETCTSNADDDPVCDR